MAKKSASKKKSVYSGKGAKDDPPSTPPASTYEIVYIDDSDIAPGKPDATLYLETDEPLQEALPNTSKVSFYKMDTTEDALVTGIVQNAISNQITLYIKIPQGSSGQRTIKIEGGGATVTTKDAIYFTL